MATLALHETPPGFFERLEAAAFSPGWAKRRPQMWPQPTPGYVPTVWRAAEALAALTESGAFVSTEFAERRNLILVNPVPDNVYPTCRNLVAAYQLVLPGETARSHRHSPNALRFVLDAAPGTYTLVDGVRIDMAPGDVVLTPQWHWHGHANTSDRPAFWIDFLDVPLVQNLDNMFFEHHPDTLEAVQGEDPQSPFRFRGDALREQARVSGNFRFAQDKMPTIGLHAIDLAAGQRQAHEGAICNSIFAVAAGSVHVAAGSISDVLLTRGDVIVVPGWHPFSFAAGQDGATLLRVTDAPVFDTLGFRDVSRDR